VAAATVVLVLLAGGGLGAYYVKYRGDADAELANQQAQTAGTTTTEATTTDAIPATPAPRRNVLTWIFVQCRVVF
jgi:hypothetical protein